MVSGWIGHKQVRVQHTYFLLGEISLERVWSCMQCVPWRQNSMYKGPEEAKGSRPLKKWQVSCCWREGWGRYSCLCKGFEQAIETGCGPMEHRWPLSSYRREGRHRGLSTAAGSSTWTDCSFSLCFDSPVIISTFQIYLGMQTMSV